LADASSAKGVIGGSRLSDNATAVPLIVSYHSITLGQKTQTARQGIGHIKKILIVERIDCEPRMTGISCA